MMKLGRKQSGPSGRQIAEMEAMIAAFHRSQAVIEFALDGTVLSANENFLGALGYRADEVVGRRHAMFVEPAYAASPEYKAFWAKLGRGEYLGLRLSDLGFTGSEDFEVSATFPAIPALGGVGQFGLYAGTRSDRVIRGGVHVVRQGLGGEYTQFLVNNADGTDTDPYRVGLLSFGIDLRVTLRRVAGRYALTVENLTAGGTSTLTIRHPVYLDGEKDLYVGLFGANTQSDVRRTLVVKEFRATVWVAAPPPER